MSDSTRGSFDGFIPEGVELRSEGWVPLYLEDRTIIGRARIKDNMMEIRVDEPKVLDAIEETLYGGVLSHEVLAPNRFKKKLQPKEKTDE